MNILKYFQGIIPIILLAFFTWPMSARGETGGVSTKLQTAIVNGLRAESQPEQATAAKNFRRAMSRGGYRMLPFSQELFPTRQSASSGSFQKELEEWNPEWQPGCFPKLDQLILDGKLKTAIGSFRKESRILLKDPINLIRMLLAVFQNLYMLGMLFFAMFGIIAMIKYGRNFHHDITRYLEVRITSNFMRVLATSLIYVLPVMFTVPLKYLPMYWILLLSPYVTKKERIGLSAGIVLTILFLVGFAYTARIGNQVSSQKFLYYRSMQTPFSQIEGFNPNSQLERFSKATNRIRRGQYSDAISFYKEIDSSSFLYPYALNNIGVAYFQLGEYELARDFFKEAAQRAKTSDTPEFNLAIVMLRTFNLTESDNDLKAAYEKNPDRTVTALMNQVQQPIPLVDVPGVRFLYQKLFLLGFPGNNDLSGFSGKKEIAFVVIMFILFLLAGFLFRDRDLSESCSRCGKPFRFLESHNDNMCKQCVTVFVKKENLDSGKRMAKVESIRKYNRFRKIIQGAIGFFIPGTYSIFITGNAICGVFLYFLLFGCILLVFGEMTLFGSWFLVSPVLLIILSLVIINLFNVLPGLGEE